ncbi:hypothetical protein HHK36_014688 [Tetracentron sinense]|uniref:glutathione transferase n=1 Tax=Tetracentron sinense TaxID=13715 RepID=A0A834Z7U4_TETSI|nr:hypothetical protein HHK36_014688 [Tetracentron sinense]
MSKGEVVLLYFWVSPFAMRAKIALEEKGVEYEAREEDLLGTKSELLLSSNPIYKKVPVLLHNGKAVCESSIVVSYIDEAWPSPPLLPSCPYERSQARFWADFIDKKVFEGGNSIWRSKGEAQEVAIKEFIETLKLLEGVLGEKDFFGGDSFGFVDIIAIPLASWFYAYEQFGSFKVEEECPKFSAWMKRCMERETVAKVIPDLTKVYEFVCMMRKMYGFE